MNTDVPMLLFEKIEKRFSVFSVYPPFFCGENLPHPQALLQLAELRLLEAGTDAVDPRCAGHNALAASAELVKYVSRQPAFHRHSTPEMRATASFLQAMLTLAWSPQHGSSSTSWSPEQTTPFGKKPFGKNDPFHAAAAHLVAASCKLQEALDQMCSRSQKNVRSFERQKSRSGQASRRSALLDKLSRSTYWLARIFDVLGETEKRNLWAGRFQAWSVLG